jgi:hypothetical protein
MFECVAAEVTSPWAFISMMARAFFDPNWREDAKVTTTQIKNGKVFSKSRSIAMTLDGEVVRLTSPAKVSIAVNGLSILVHAPQKLADDDMSGEVVLVEACDEMVAE